MYLLQTSRAGKSAPNYRFKYADLARAKAAGKARLEDGTADLVQILLMRDEEVISLVECYFRTAAYPKMARRAAIR